MKLQYYRFKIVLTAETAVRRATTISWLDRTRQPECPRGPSFWQDGPIIVGRCIRAAAFERLVEARSVIEPAQSPPRSAGNCSAHLVNVDFLFWGGRHPTLDSARQSLSKFGKGGWPNDHYC